MPPTTALGAHPLPARSSTTARATSPRPCVINMIYDTASLRERWRSAPAHVRGYQARIALRSCRYSDLNWATRWPFTPEGCGKPGASCENRRSPDKRALVRPRDRRMGPPPVPTHLVPAPACSLGYFSASAIFACHSCNSRSDLVLFGPILSEAVPHNDAAVLYSAVLRGHLAIVDSQKDRMTMS